MINDNNDNLIKKIDKAKTYIVTCIYFLDHVCIRLYYIFCIEKYISISYWKNILMSRELTYLYNHFVMCILLKCMDNRFMHSNVCYKILIIIFLTCECVNKKLWVYLNYILYKNTLYQYDCQIISSSMTLEWHQTLSSYTFFSYIYIVLAIIVVEFEQ